MPVRLILLEALTQREFIPGVGGSSLPQWATAFEPAARHRRIHAAIHRQTPSPRPIRVSHSPAGQNSGVVCVVPQSEDWEVDPTVKTMKWVEQEMTSGLGHPSQVIREMR